MSNEVTVGYCLMPREVGLNFAKWLNGDDPALHSKFETGAMRLWLHRDRPEPIVQYLALEMAFLDPPSIDAGGTLAKRLKMEGAADVLVFDAEATSQH